MSGCQPRAALAARRAHHQHLYVLHSDCRGSGTDRPAAPHTSKLHSTLSGGGAARGTGGVSQPEKHLSRRRRCDQTNQRRLENMISPGEECESWGTLQGCCTLFRYAACRKKAWWDQRCRLWGWFKGPAADMSSRGLWWDSSGYSKPARKKRKVMTYTEGEWNYLKQLSHFLARTSRKEVKFLLGLCIQRLVELEGGVVAVWCWLAAWGLGRGDHEEAISPSMSGPVGNAEIPPPLAQKTLPESAGI